MLNRSNRKSDINAVVFSASTVIVVTFIGQILGTFNQILLARYLGPDNYGTFNLGLSVLSIVAVLSMAGTSAGTTRYITKYLVSDSYSKLNSTISFSIIFNFISSIIFSLLIFFYSDYIAVSLFDNSNLSFVLKIFSFNTSYTKFKLYISCDYKRFFFNKI